MKKNWKRLLASILCVAMMASMLPASAVEEIGEDVTGAVEAAVESVAEALEDILPPAQSEETQEVSSPTEPTEEPTEAPASDGPGEPEATGEPEVTEGPEPTEAPEPKPTEDDGDVEVQDATPDFSGVYIDQATGKPAGKITLTGASASTTTYTVTFVINYTVGDHNAFEVADAAGIGSTAQDAAFGSSASKNGIEGVIFTGYMLYQWAVAGATELSLDAATPKYIASDSFAFTTAAVDAYWADAGIEGVSAPSTIPVGMVFREGSKYTAKAESVPFQGETNYSVTVRTYIDVPTANLDTTSVAPRNVSTVSSVALYKGSTLVSDAPEHTTAGVYTFPLSETGTYVVRINGTAVAGSRGRVVVSDTAPTPTTNIGFYTVRIIATLDGATSGTLLTSSNAKIWNRTVSGNDVPAGTSRTAILLPGQYVGISSQDVEGYNLTARTGSNGMGGVSALSGADGVYSAQLPNNATIAGAGNTLTANERPTITLEFETGAPTSREASLTFMLNGSAWEGATVTITSDAAGETVVDGPTATDATGKVSFDVPVSETNTTYYVQVAEQTSGTTQSFSLNNSTDTAFTRTYQFFKVTIRSADENLGKVAFGSSPATGEAGPIDEIAPGGTSLTLNAIPEGANPFANWVKDGDDSTADTTNPKTVRASATTYGTYVANFEKATYEKTVTVSYNGADIASGNPTTAVFLIPAGTADPTPTTPGRLTQTVNMTNGSTLTFSNLDPANSYDVYLRGVGAALVPTGKTISADGDNVKINRVSAVAETAGNGKVTVTDNSAVGFGSATTANSNAGTTNTLWVLEGSSVSWSTTPDTHFQFDHWDDDTDDTTEPKTVASIGGTGETHVGHFVRKTSDVTVNFYKDSVAEANAYAPGTGAVSFDDGDGSTTDPSENVASSATSVVVTVPHGIAYTVKYGGVDTQIGSVTVTDDEATHSVDVIFYGVSLESNDAAKGKVQFTGEGSLAATAGPKYLLPGQTVGVTGQAETNNNFVKWERTDGTDGSLTTDTVSEDGMTGTNTFTVGKSAATLTATFEAGLYSQNVTVTWNDAAPSGSQSADIALWVTGAGSGTGSPAKTATANTANGGVAAFTGLSPETAYDVYVKNGASYVKTSQVIDAATPGTVNLVSAVAETAGNGRVTVTDNTNNGFGSATTATSNAGDSVTLWVLEGASVSWSTTPDTHFQFDHWDDDTDDTTEPKTVTIGAEGETHEGHFVRKTSDVTVNFYKDSVGAGNAYAPGAAAVLFDDGDGSTTDPTVNAAAGDTSVTVTVPHGIAYTVKYDGVDTQIGSVTVTDDTDTHTVNVIFYGVSLASNNAAKGKVQFTGEGSLAATAGPKYLLPGQTVGVTGVAETDNIFVEWARTSGTAGSLTTDTVSGDRMTGTNTFTVGKSAATLTATFSKETYTANITVRVDGVALEGASVTLTGKTPATTNASGQVTVNGLSAGTSYTVSVAKAGDVYDGTYTLRQTDAENDVTLVLDFYTLTVKVGTGSSEAGNKVRQTGDAADDVSGSATDTIAYLTTTKLNTADPVTTNKTVTVTATPAGGWRLYSWANATGNAGTQGAAATGSVTVSTAAVEVTANFKQMYEVTAKQPANGDYTAVAASPSANFAPASGDDTKWVDVDSYVTVGGVDPDTGFRFDGWVVTEGTLYSDSDLTTAATAAEIKDPDATLYFKPTATGATVVATFVEDSFDVELVLFHNDGSGANDLTARQIVQIKDGNTLVASTETAEVTGSVKAITYASQKYTVDNLTSNSKTKSYDLYVNGYKVTGVTIQEPAGSNTYIAQVDMWKIDVALREKAGAAESDIAANTSSSNPRATIKTTLGAASYATVYVPQAVEADQTIALSEFADGDLTGTTHYRKANASGEKLWTVGDDDTTTGVGAGVYTITGMGGDKTLYAHFVKQYKVTARMVASQRDTSYVDDITAGTVTKSGADAANATGAADLADVGTRVKVSMTTPDSGTRLKGWTVADGTLTSAHTAATGGSVVSAADGYYKVADTNDLYVLPGGDLILEAETVENVAKAQITVKYDGDLFDAVDDAHGVEIKRANGTVLANTNNANARQEVVKASTGTYTFDYLPASDPDATFAVWVNGYDTGVTLSVPAEGATATAEVTLIKVEPGVTVNGAASTSATGHEAVIKGGSGTSYPNDTSVMYVPAGQDNSVTYTATAGTDANNIAYRMATSTKDGVYSWTWGTALQSNTATGTATVNSDDDVVLTAAFIAQYQVAAATGASDAGSVAIEDKDAADTTSPVTVDHGDYAKVTATAAGDQIIKDSAFINWTAVNTGTTDAATGAYGTDSAGTGGANTNNPAYYYPVNNTTLTANFKNLTATKYVVGTGSDVTMTTDGVTINVSAGYTASAANTATITIANLGNMDTDALTNISITGTDAAAFGTPTPAAATVGAVADGDEFTIDVPIEDGLSLDTSGATPAAKTYSATLNVTDGDLVLAIPVKVVVGLPTTFDAVVETYVDGSEDPNDLGIDTGNDASVVLVSGNTVVKGTYTAAGTWSFANLRWANTYNIYVNGYDTGKTVTNAHVAAGNTDPFTADNLNTVGWTATSYDGDSDTTANKIRFSTVSGIATTFPAVTVYAADDKTVAVPNGKAVNLSAGTPKTGYRHDGWMASGNTTLTGAPANTKFTGASLTMGDTVADGGVRIEPVYLLQFTVQIATGLPTGTTAQLRRTGTSAWYTSRILTQGDTADIHVTAPAGYTFSKWTVNVKNVDGTDTPYGSFTDATVAGTTTAPNLFTPDFDTEGLIGPNAVITLTPVFLQHATLVIADDEDATPGTSATYSLTDSEKEPVLTYTPNDGSALPTGIQWVKGTTADWTTPNTLGAGDYTGTLDNPTLTTTWLQAQGVGTYHFRAVYDLGTDEPGNADGLFTNVVTLTIKVDVKNLTEVNVEVQGDSTATTAASGEKLTYVDHTDPKILTQDLAWQWYSADAEPDQGDAPGTIPTTWTAIPDGQGGKTDTVTLSDNEKGKYVFAVVTASNTGTGSVVTNAFPVDYDADVTVNVDDDPIEAGDKAKYEIVLVHPTDAGKNVTLTGDDFSGGKYSTSGSALEGGVSYTVTVNRVSGTTGTKVATGKSVAPTSQSAELDFYSVTTHNFVWDHFEDDSSTPQKVGETETTVGVAKVETTNETAVTVASGEAVLTGTGLKVTSDTWNQDYTLSWRSNATGTFADADKKGTDATSGTTAAVLTALSNVTAETHIGGKLKQNTYQVQGKVVATGGAKVDTAILTLVNGDDTYTFNSNIPAGGAGNDVTVTFTVPKTLDADTGAGALKGPYTLTATGSNNPPTTIKGYDVTAPFGAAAEVTDPPELAVSTGGDLYRIYAEASRYSLNLTDSDSVSANGAANWNAGAGAWNATTGTASNSGKTGTDALALDYDAVDYTFKLTNNSNEKLYVTLTAPTAVAGFTLTPATGVTAGTAFELAPGASTADFKVTFAAGQSSGTHNFAVNFTSKLSDNTTTGPAMAYNLAVEVKTAEITTVTMAPHSGTVYANGVQADQTAVTVDYGAGDVAPETADAGDIEYVWVVKATNVQPTATEIAAGTKAGSYTIQAADAGKYLWLVAQPTTGSQRLTGQAFTSAAINYDAAVTLLDKDDSDAHLGDTGYTVVISPADDATDAGAITAAWNNTGKYFETTGGKLSPTVATYYVFVNKVEGDVTVLERKTTITRAGIDAADGVADASVNYYQVKFDDHASVVNAYAGMDETGIIASTDETYKLRARVTGVTDPLTTGKHVVTGTAVSFDETKDWGAQDYKLDWYVNTTADTADQAFASNGISKTYSSSVDTIKAQLVQETYTVTAYVKKAGAVTGLTLSDGNNTYTTGASTGTTFNAMTGGAVYSSITGNATGNQVPFLKIPKGTYTLVDLDTVIQAGTTKVGSTGYGVPYSATATQGDDPASITVNGNSAFGVYLDGSVYSLTLDDALTGRGSDHTGDALATVDGTITDDVIYSTVVTRDYGWTDTSNDTITLTLSNTGNTPLTDIKAELTALADPDDKAFTVDLGSFDAGSTKTLGYVEGAAAETDSTITIDLHNTDSGAPLPAGDYDLTITFNYKVMGTYLEKSLVYKLKLSVEAAGLGDISFIDVTDSNREIDDTDPNVSVDDTLKVEDVEDSNGNVLDHSGLQFTWVAVPHGTSVTVNGLDDLLTAGTATQIQQGVGAGSGKDTYDAVADTYEGQDIYVLVEADPDAANPVTTSKKLTHVAVVKYTATITVKADSTTVTDDDYTIVLTDDADGSTVTATWNGTNAYEAEDLITGHTYSVEAGAIQGTGLAATVDTGADVVYTDKAKTVDYYTVNITSPTTTNEYKTGTGEVFDATHPIPALSGTHASVAYASGTPVLKGEKVTVISDAWGQDYSLTWQTKTGTGGNSTEPAAWTDGAKQDSNTAHATGTGALTINEKTWVTAKLDQNTYTVTGTIVDDTGDKLSVVTMKASFNGTDITFTTDTTDTDYGIGVKGDSSKSVTFVVPNGAYTVTAAEAAGSGVTITGMAAPHGGTQVAGKSVGVTVNKAAATFDILLQESDIKLQVADDLAANGNADFTSNGPGTNVTGDVTLVYSYAATDTPHTGAGLADNGTLVTLTNPGNTDLTVSVKISQIKGGTTTVLYDATTANLAGTMDGITITAPDLAAAGATRLVANGDVTDGTDEWKVATIAVAPGLENVDDVQVKFEFTSVTPTGETGPSVTYVYDLSIDPLPLKAGDWEVDGKATRPATAGVGDTLQPKGTDVDNDTVRSNIVLNYKGADKTALVAGITDTTDTADVAYAWFRAAANNLDKTGFKLDKTDADAYAVTLADGTAPIATGATYPVVEDDMTKSLYLVIYATGAASNADDFTVVGPIATQFMPKVYVFADRATTAPDTQRVTGENDPGYTLYLAPDGVGADDVATGGIALAWDKDSGSYRPGSVGAWQSIDPGTTYNVWAANAKAADTGNYAYAKVGEFTANDTASGHDIQRAYYYSVNYNKAVQLDHTNGSAAVSSAIKGSYTDGLSAKVGNVALADGEQILKDQDLVFTMDATAQTGAAAGEVNTWDDDASRAHYKMSWSANLTGATNDNAYPAGTDAVTHTVSNVGQTVGTTNNKVTATLKQQLYTVKFKVVDKDGSTETSVGSADLESAETGVTLKRTDGTNRHHNEFIEFTNVPAGEYTMTAYAGGGTLIVNYSVKIGAADAVVTTDKASLTKGTPDASVQGDIDGSNHIVTIAKKSFSLNWRIDKSADKDGSDFRDASTNETISLSAEYKNADVESTKYDLRLYNTGDDAQHGVVVTTQAAEDTTSEAIAFPVGGGATLMAKIYDADGNTDGVEYDLKDTNGVDIPAGGYAEILDVQIANVPDPSDPDSEATTAAGTYGLNLSAISNEMKNEDLDPDVFRARYTIVPINYVQLPPVLIADASGETYFEVSSAVVGETVTAFFVDDKDAPADLVPGGATNEAVSPTGGTDNASYQWFYGPAGKDPSADLTGLTSITDAAGNAITTKTLDITNALVDAMRAAGDNGKQLYVLATAVEDNPSLYVGKSWDDTEYTNPAYTVRVVVKQLASGKYGGTVADVNGHEVVDTADCTVGGGNDDHSFSVQRGSGQALTATAADADEAALGGYLFDHWEVNDNNGDPKVYYGTFGGYDNGIWTSAEGQNTEGSTVSFYPTADAIVTAVFKPVSAYDLEIKDDNTVKVPETHDDVKLVDFGTIYVGEAIVNPFTAENVTISNLGDAQKVTAVVTASKGQSADFTIGSAFTGFLTGKDMARTGDENHGDEVPFTIQPNITAATAEGEHEIKIAVTGAQGGEDEYTARYALVRVKVGVENVTPPKNEEAPDFEHADPVDPENTVVTPPDPETPENKVVWKDPEGTELTPEDKFKPGTYTAEVIIEPDPDSGFSWDDLTEEEIVERLKPTFNGTPADEVVKNPDGSLTLIKRFTISPPPTPGGGGSTVGCYPVYYYIGVGGTTNDSTIETVDGGKKPIHVPAVEVLDGYKFLGWSRTDPAQLGSNEDPVLVDPTTVQISGATTFYAVYGDGHTMIDHKHYVIGYPNGTFGPADSITRGSVATIIARACLDGFVEGANYGNPGGYSDVSNDWAYSAISYCTMHGVFKGYDDGTFRPGQPITRQELATVVARLAGLKSYNGLPFDDAEDIGDWAKDGVYTAYVNGWVNGYTDGTFRPKDNIQRDETVKVFNAYLKRGVNAEGLESLTEYIHTGVASNNTGDGLHEYMVWPDVPKGHWAYYEIIEAANDHTFYYADEENKTPPETWSTAKIDERWRYHDNAADGGPQS